MLNESTVKKRILITGASGRIGQVLAAAWAEKYHLHLMDICKPSYSFAGADFRLSNVTDIDQMRALCSQVDLVVHLAINGNQADDWDRVASVNLQGTWSVYQAASEAGVERVVYASSVMIDFAPESLRGVKALGRNSRKSICCVKNTPLSILCLRLGAVAGSGDTRIAIGNKSLDHILTHRDLARLFTAGIEAPSDIRYGVFYGISANQPSCFDITNTQKILGYHPQDDAFRLARRNLFTPKGLYNMTILLNQKDQENSEENMEIISVIIPAYNAERYLRQAVVSVLEQTYPPLEILIITGPSTDNTTDLAKSFGDPVRVINEERLGDGIARNAGIRQAKGEYLSFLDADDYWPPNKLSTQIDALKKDPELDMVFGFTQEFRCSEDPEGPITFGDRLPAQVAGVLVIRKSSFMQVGLYEEHYVLGSSVSWYLRARECGLRESLFARNVTISANPQRQPFTSTASKSI